MTINFGTSGFRFVFTWKFANAAIAVVACNMLSASGDSHKLKQFIEIRWKVIKQIVFIAVGGCLPLIDNCGRFSEKVLHAGYALILKSKISIARYDANLVFKVYQAIIDRGCRKE